MRGALSLPERREHRAIGPMPFARGEGVANRPGARQESRRPTQASGSATS
jgi:hypothetical protein